MNAAVLRILFLEDEPSDAGPVERVLERAGVGAVIRVVETADAFSGALREFSPDLVLSSHSGDGFTALHALTAIRATRPATPLILVTSAVNEAVVVESLKAGADDYIFKDRLDRLVPAIRAALALRQPLTRLTSRQFEVLRLLVTGLSTRETAGRLGVSVKTVETHRTALMRRLDILHLPGLMRYALRIGLVPPDPYGVRKDGTEIPVEIGLTPFEMDERLLVPTSVVDIASYKRAENELRRSNEELERFATVASHDLQEPLRTVGSYVQLLGKQYRGKLDAEADEFIGYALDGVLRMRELIDDLLAYARVGTRGSAFVSTDMNALLERVLASLRLAIEESEAWVTLDPLPTVQADPGQLEQLLVNLVSNALKFRGAEPPRVRISAVRRDREWLFSVQDNGIGIEPEYFERIFVIFQRLHGREKYQGTGIGLAIAKKIAERHGGRIWAESEPGLGATFHFTLPDTIKA